MSAPETLDAAAAAPLAWSWNDETLRRLSTFLEEQSICKGTVSAIPIGEGHSNLTYRVSDGVSTVVVRRPPVQAGHHDILREATILRALQGSGVPAPRVLATAEANTVLDVPFYVMSYIDGPVVTTTTPTPLDDPDARAEIGDSMVDALVALHRFDWQPALRGRPEGSTRRHLDRMSALISDDAGELPAAFRPMHDYLARTVPPETAAALVHNDFRLGNLLLAPARPGRLGAVLDWELAAVGDPLLDLGYLLASIPVRGTEFTPVQEMGTAFLEPGYPTRSDIVERYSKAMSPALGNLEWYIAFAQWKLAVLYEYSRGRLLAGVGDEYYRDPGKVTAFLEAAEAEATS